MTLNDKIICYFKRIEPCGLCNSEEDTCAYNHHDLLLEILLIGFNALIISTKRV